MVLNREALRDLALSRRTDGTPERAALTWHCEFCLRNFQTENGFMRHHCAERERLEELKSPRGQAAYSLYSQWMRLHKRSVPDQERFMASKQFTYFMKFVDWADKTALPNMVQFVALMVQTGTQPVLWCRDTTYAMYLQWYDNAYPPTEQFIEAYDFLVNEARELKVPLSQIYPALGASTVAQLVRRRKISPWLLVISPNFLRWLQTLPDEDRDRVAEAVNFAAWAGKLNDNPELAKELRKVCESENV